MNSSFDRNLQEVIKSVAAKIKRYADVQLSEAGTKASLIEPVLNALGWNTSDPEEVQYEYRPSPKDNPVDYALKLQREPRLFVEAKALGRDLSEHKWITQILSEAPGAGIPFGPTAAPPAPPTRTDTGEYRRGSMPTSRTTP